MKKRGRLSAQGLDEEVVEAFRKYVIQRYGKLHTVFGQELQKAMEAYLENINTPSQYTIREKTHQRKNRTYRTREPRDIR